MDVSKLCKQNQDSRYEIVDLREKILKLEEEIKVNEKKIWKECEHEWKWDTASGMYEKNCIINVVKSI